jgi:hypothetical protein
MAQITIGPRFFEGAFKDYANRYWAWVREAMQNAMDAGSTQISIGIDHDGANTRVTVWDNGCGMDQDTLVNKLLSLGGSGKEFANGAVGGFGKAKELLFFCQESYEIRTGHLTLKGSGAEYELREDLHSTYVQGVIAQVVWKGDVAQDLRRQFENFCRYAQWSGQVWLNDRLLETNLKKGSRRVDLPFGVVYTNRTLANIVIVRINGIPMFHMGTSHEGCVIVELVGSSENTLTANRDGLKWTYQQELQGFLTALCVDKKSALRSQQARYRRFQGGQLAVSCSKSAQELLGMRSQQIEADGLIGTIIQQELSSQEFLGGLGQGTGVQIQTVERVESPDPGVLGHEFIVKNTTGLETPPFYLPDNAFFGSYQRTLARYWAECLLELHRLVGHSATFSVGFVLDDQSEAECEHGDYGLVYYVNPIEVIQQKGSTSRSFRKRFKLTEKHRILALAVHEFVHGLGYSAHDEDYAGKLTDLMGLVLANLKRFSGCFK